MDISSIPPSVYLKIKGCQLGSLYHAAAVACRFVQEINLIEARGGRLTRGISNVLKGCRGVLTVISFAVPKSV